MTDTFQYSVLRMTPDPRRGEIMNIGIVVFTPDGADVHILHSPAKLAALDANISMDEIFKLRTLIPELVADELGNNAKHDALQHIGYVSASEVGWFMSSPGDYARSVNDLMRTLVIPPARPKRVTSHPRLVTEVRTSLKKHDLMGKNPEDIHSNLIVPDFPISPSENLTTDLAGKNGTYWITEIADFRPVTMVGREALKLSALKMATFVKARDELGDDTKTIALYAAPSSTEKDINPQLTLLFDRADHVWNYESDEDYSAFINKMREITHHTSENERTPVTT